MGSSIDPSCLCLQCPSCLLGSRGASERKPDLTTGASASWVMSGEWSRADDPGNAAGQRGQAQHQSLQSCSCCVCTDQVVFSERGRSLPSAPSVVFLEEALLRADPFASETGALPLQVGAVCSLCSGQVCLRRGCSLFYARRFCRHCARKHRNEFPAEVVKLEREAFEA